MKLLILHIPVINFDQINFTLFCPENITLPIREIYRILSNHALLIYNNDSVGIASFLTDMYLSIIDE